MKNIAFNKPKFILPLILLPFIYGLNFAALRITDKEEPKSNLETMNQFNTNIPDPVGLQEEKTKLEALKENLYSERDFTGMQNIGEEEEKKMEKDNPLGRTKFLIDSIQKANDSLRTINEKKKEAIANRKSRITSKNRSTTTKRNYGTAYNPREQKTVQKKQPSEKELFVEQMRIIDSIQNPEKYVNTSDSKEKSESDIPKLKLKKAVTATSDYFNTITEKKPKSQASAILDEGLTVYDQSRVRIRLLDDIYIGDYLMKKGQYLYALVSGFSGQRVLLTIESALIEDQIVEVDIRIYDNDGIEGIYIPDTLFREFLAELESNSLQTMGQQQGQDLRNTGNRGVGQALSGGLNKLTSAFGRAAKRNKAKLKYNTVVYLVN